MAKAQQQSTTPHTVDQIEADEVRHSLPMEQCIGLTLGPRRTSSLISVLVLSTSDYRSDPSSPPNMLDHRSSDLTSLSSSIRNHVYENGRRYHSLNAGTYNLPNDEVSFSPGVPALLKLEVY